MNTMKRALRLGFETCKLVPRRRFTLHGLYQCRSIATHTFSHYASALSVLPTNVNTSSAEFKENTAEFGAVMDGMRALHQSIESGGSPKAREKHIARGKMLPREYVPEFSISVY